MKDFYWLLVKKLTFFYSPKHNLIYGVYDKSVSDELVDIYQIALKVKGQGNQHKLIEADRAFMLKPEDWLSVFKPMPIEYFAQMSLWGTPEERELLKSTLTVDYLIKLLTELDNVDLTQVGEWDSSRYIREYQLLLYKN